jgi:hypothetical protein
MRVNPALFRSTIASVLLDPNNMSEYSIHHEYFVLLRDGFQHLRPDEQDRILAAIQRGPTPDDVAEFREYHKAKPDVDEAKLEERVAAFCEHWMAQRLWMIRSSLAGAPADRLKKALADLEIEKLEHPEFLSWVGDATPVARAPVTAEDFAAMNPQDLVELIRQWRPPAPAAGGFPWMQPTVEKMAAEFADAIRAVPERLLPIVAAFGEGEPYAYLYHYFLAVKELAQDEKNPIPWKEILDVASRLVERDRHPELWDASSKHGPFLALLWAMEVALRRDVLDDDMLDRLRAVLVRLSEHPDRTSGDSAASDALNHVVPQAIESLVIVVSLQADRANNRGLGDQLRLLLDSLLADESDEAKGCYWILGSLFSSLHWLDRDWAVANTDRLFAGPSTNLAAAALGGHLHARFYLSTYPLVREYYRRLLVERAAGNAGEDAVMRIAHAYLAGAEELPAADPSSLLAIVFARHPGQIAAKFPWLYYVSMHEEEKATPPTQKTTAFLDKHWPRLRGLLLWRARDVGDQGFPPEIDDEFDWYARWIGCLTDAHEALSARIEMLRLILPFLCRARYGAREDVVSFLAQHAEQSPREIVSLFRAMCEGVPPGAFVDGTVTADVRKIVETAASAEGEARDDALAVANWYGARGSLELRDVFERYHRV